MVIIAIVFAIANITLSDLLERERRLFLQRPSGSIRPESTGFLYATRHNDANNPLLDASFPNF